MKTEITNVIFLHFFTLVVVHMYMYFFAYFKYIFHIFIYFTYNNLKFLFFQGPDLEMEVS